VTVTATSTATSPLTMAPSACMTSCWMSRLPDYGTARAIDTGGRLPPAEFPDRGSYEWVIIACFLAGGVVMLIVWGLALYARLTHRFEWASDDEEGASR
jgi:hypothetical protein